LLTFSIFDELKLSALEEQSKQRILWQHPWGYTEGAIISLALLLLGFLLDFLSNFEKILFPPWPFNLFIGLSFIAIVALVYYFYRYTILINWLASVSASIHAIVLYGILALALGLIPQTESSVNDRFFSNLYHINTSWIFVIASTYLITCLLLVIMKRLRQNNKRNPGFLINHFGLFLILFAAGIGSSDLKKVQVVLEEGKITEYGYNNDNLYIKFPFKIKLDDFTIDEYSSKIALVDVKTKSIDVHLKNNLFLAEKGIEKSILDYKIKVLEYLPAAAEDSLHNFFINTDSSSVPAAKVQVRNHSDSIIALHWITCGGFTVKPLFVFLDNDYFLAMTYPEPKKLRSLIEIFSDNGKKKKVELMVNKPYSFMGWTLYQLSYDKQMGKYSSISVLEAVRDPWLPVVYIGILLLISGAFYMFWIGKNIKD
jgi:hypothetical protein